MKNLCLCSNTSDTVFERKVLASAEIPLDFSVQTIPALEPRSCCKNTFLLINYSTLKKKIQFLEKVSKNISSFIGYQKRKDIYFLLEDCVGYL